MRSTPPTLSHRSPYRLYGRLNLFETTMIVMGGIIGSGIFINPAIVAQQVDTYTLILGAWIVGGIIALLGAFIYAELATHCPDVGGQYAYLRECYHPALAFMYGWALLLVIQTGGMAAVAVTFARYFVELTRVAANEQLIAVLTLGLLTLINCLGVRAGSALQSALMVLKIIAIAALILCGLLTEAQSLTEGATLTSSSRSNLFNFGTAMVPVLFAYGGWQTASFVTAEIKDPQTNLPRALVIGVIGVLLLYVSVNFVCLKVLGIVPLARTQAPAAEVMRLALGDVGARLIAIGIAISTLGFLSQGMLTGPRVYFAMAADGLFFKSVASLNKRSNVPAVAIALQGAMAVVIALSGKYEQILLYVVSTDFIFYGLTAVCIFIYRHRLSGTGSFRMPGHPWTTVLFALACWAIVINSIYQNPINSLIGNVIMLLGIPAYLFWRTRRVE